MNPSFQGGNPDFLTLSAIVESGTGFGGGGAVSVGAACAAGVGCLRVLRPEAPVGAGSSCGIIEVGAGTVTDAAPRLMFFRLLVGVSSKRGAVEVGLGSKQDLLGGFVGCSACSDDLLRLVLLVSGIGCSLSGVR